MKTDNAMAPHFRKAVQEIDSDIAKLRDDIATLEGVREGIVNLYGGDTEIAPAPENAKKPAKPRAKKVNVAAAYQAEVHAGEAKPKGKAPSAETVKTMAVMRTCPEPFTTASLQVATGYDVKFLGNTLNRLKAKGYLESVGRGEFKRTAAFPATAEAAE